MKPIRQQFKEALGLKGKSVAWYRDFALTVTAGVAILYGAIFGWSANSTHSPFDLKVAMVCFAVAGVCVLFAADKLLALSCAVMVPAALMTYHVAFTWDRKVLAFYFGSLTAGFAVLVVGVFVRSMWQARSARRSR
jgi:hypothetical protein